MHNHNPLKIDAALSRQQVKATYRHLKGALSIATRYESVATRQLVRHGDFSHANSIFEFGCGTGHFAADLLKNHLPETANYLGYDITPELIDVASKQLSKFGDRAQVMQSNGGPPVAEAPASYDRFVSNFVFDILPDNEIKAVLCEAYRVLGDDGLLCLSSLAPGKGALSRHVMKAWAAVYKRRPGMLGGCRPIELLSLLDRSQWTIQFNATAEPLGIPLEIVVAKKIRNGL